MEPTKAPIEYLIDTKAIYVKEIFQDKYISGVGKDATFEKVSLGWYLFLEGSHEAICLGKTQPEIMTNDEIEIIVRKKRHAKPSQPPV